MVAPSEAQKKPPKKLTISEIVRRREKIKRLLEIDSTQKEAPTMLDYVPIQGNDRRALEKFILGGSNSNVPNRAETTALKRLPQTDAAKISRVIEVQRTWRAHKEFLKDKPKAREERKKSFRSEVSNYMNILGVTKILWSEIYASAEKLIEPPPPME
ncbi:MAG: hypothetical protein ACD_21C00286G0006 [uncultured bacterium]|nr:MAG: hypothetical protein ACD_21C00286G0006 [uncultured bacterium]